MAATRAGDVTEEPIGRCHLCQQDDRFVKWCPPCSHWFCEECRGKYFRRGLAAVHAAAEKVSGVVQGGACCGPKEHGADYGLVVMSEGD